jgi:hypothetical protein
MKIGTERRAKRKEKKKRERKRKCEARRIREKIYCLGAS